MSDSNGTTGMQSSLDFSDEVIRRFLLGNLRDDERPAFEARLFADDELEARVRLAELDFADEYAFEHLNPEDEKLFARAFLVTADRRRALKVSNALHDRYAYAPWLELNIAQRVKSLFLLRKPVWKYAFAALVVILLIATVWLVTKEPQIAKRFFPKHAVPKPSASATPQVSHHPSNTPSAPGHAEQSPALPAHELPAMTVVIEPNNTIDKAPTIKLPAGDRDLVRLQLVAEKTSSASYRAEIISLDRGSVFSVESLTAVDGSKINLDVPARVLTTGKYHVKLNGVDRSKQDSEIYYFRVQ